MKWLKSALILSVILAGLLSLGAKGCAWTNQDPDIVTGSSGEPTPASVQTGSSESNPDNQNSK
ncbi:MAG: hypothetical protein AAB019_01205 [Planctomycetota bacterium]